MFMDTEEVNSTILFSIHLICCFRFLLRCRLCLANSILKGTMLVFWPGKWCKLTDSHLEVCPGTGSRACFSLKNFESLIARAVQLQCWFPFIVQNCTLLEVVYLISKLFKKIMKSYLNVLWIKYVSQLYINVYIQVKSYDEVCSCFLSGKGKGKKKRKGKKKSLAVHEGKVGSVTVWTSKLLFEEWLESEFRTGDRNYPSFWGEPLSCNWKVLE